MSSWYSNETQIRWACRMLLSGREISHAHEIAEASGCRLSAIIHRLRTRYNWPIDTRYDTNRIGHYRLTTKYVDELEKPRSFLKKGKDGATSNSEVE